MLTADVGESLVSSLEQERKALVIEAEQAENGGVQVVDVDRVLSGAEPDVVG